MAEERNTRLHALEILLEAEKRNIFVKDALHKLLFQKQYLSKQDRAFITRLVEGVTEYQVKLDYVIDSYSKTKVNKCKPFIRCVLRLGVYQILYMDSVPDEAACNECVKLTKKKGFQNLSGFVNGVLRNVARNKEDIHFPTEDKDLLSYLSVEYSMPMWIVERMIGWYGIERTKTVLRAGLATPDLTIRVNTNKITKKELVKKLKEKNIVVTDGFYVQEALHLDRINYVGRLPGFKQGEFFIQDESSMLLYHAAEIEEQIPSNSNPETGKSDSYVTDTRGRNNKVLHILDLCAAPGGKATHFAQMLGNRAEVEARDVSDKKIALIEENRQRLGLTNIHTRVWDALVPDADRKEWADVVIADLPCSGFGIISKKNDIKYHIKELQLTELANLQRTILTNAADYVKPGGILLYSTCTINPEENRENAEWFLSHFPFEAVDIRRRLPVELQSGFIADNMLQILPGEVKCDGFFIAKFRKKISAEL